MNVCVVGAGYVGLVTAACLARAGHKVRCIDINREKIASLRLGNPHFYEPGLSEVLREALEMQCIDFQDRLDTACGCEIILITVGTPMGEGGSADLQYVLEVAKEIAEKVDHNVVVAVKSTVPPGSCAAVQSTINQMLAKLGKKIEMQVVSNPEFLREGVAVHDFDRPDRIVIGLPPRSHLESMFLELYCSFITENCQLIFTDIESSELTKYAANAMLATRISFMNQLSALSEKLGGNIEDIRLGVGMDHRIGPHFLQAGPGFGGSCFPKDLAALVHRAHQVGVDMPILDAVIEVNEKQKERCAQRLVSFAKENDVDIVAIWGLAFKADTDDVRESPALYIVRSLVDHGIKVHCFDSLATEQFRLYFGENNLLQYFDHAMDACEGAHVLAVLTDASEFCDPDWQEVYSRLSHKAVFDFRNIYLNQDLRSRGFIHESIGVGLRASTDTSRNLSLTTGENLPIFSSLLNCEA